jgi:signal transduction histidine kinase
MKVMELDARRDYGRPADARPPSRITGRLGGLIAPFSLPRRTIRLRLTLLYGTLFLLCGAVLEAITYVLVEHSPFLGHGPLTGAPSVTGPDSSPHASSAADGSSVPPKIHPSATAHVIYARELAQYGADLHDLLVWSLVALGITAVVAVAVGWAVAGRALRPIRTITAAARDISAISLHERLALSGPQDELKELGDTFDALLARLEDSFESQRRFVANASHELRTPLTYIRTAADIALRKRESPPSPQTIALSARVAEGLDQVDRLLESLLLLARADYATAEADLVVVSLRDLLHAAIGAKTGEIADKNLDVRYAVTTDAFVAGNRTLLSRMVDNVFGNAVRHNEPDGWIRVSIELDGPIARLLVENGGRVLDELQVQELARPFRRLGVERTASGKGLGLGLSIVAAIATAYGGALRLSARPDGGLRTVVELPASTAPARAGSAR